MWTHFEKKILHDTILCTLKFTFQFAMHIVIIYLHICFYLIYPMNNVKVSNSLCLYMWLDKLKIKPYFGEKHIPVYTIQSSDLLTIKEF